MDNKPLISIIIPVYNAEEYIKTNIECALNQTYENIEIIYVCDGCSDDSVSIIKGYMQDPRIALVERQVNIVAALSRS